MKGGILMDSKQIINEEVVEKVMANLPDEEILIRCSGIV